MEVLMDTHAFLWYLYDDPRLSDRAASTIDSRDNDKLLSMASIWEIAIKVQMGKLSLGCTVEQFIQSYVADALVEVLPMTLADIVAYADLPLHHRDPFDRMIVAHAIPRDAPVITSDPAFEQYGVRTIW